MRDVLLPMAAVAGVALALLVLAVAHPVLARMAARNAFRRRTRVLIVTFGLLIGTAIISSSLAVGDTMEFIFTGEVYGRLDAIDVTVSREVNGQLFDFPESYFVVLRDEAATRGVPLDGLAPVLQRVMPVRNGPTGNQAITVQGLDEARESGFGGMTSTRGAAVTLAALPPNGVYVNEAAARDLNATVGDALTMFYGTTNQTVVYAVVSDVVRGEGKAAYDGRSIVFMPLARAQEAFRANGSINLVKASAPGPAIGGEEGSGPLAEGLRRIVSANAWTLDVREVKADGLRQAQEIADQVVELFLVMGSFAIHAGVLLIVNVFVMLAEERKAEMGVVRAVGLKRHHLTLGFVLEGAIYAALAAFAGAIAGLGLGWLMILIFNALFAGAAGIGTLTFHADPGSVLLAFAAGVLITITAVAVASAALSRLNIVRAIRNLSEPPSEAMTPAHRWLVFLTVLGGPVLALRGFELVRLPLPGPDLSLLPYAAAVVLLAGIAGVLAARLRRVARSAALALRAMEIGFVLLVAAAAYAALVLPPAPEESLGMYRIACVPLLAVGLASWASRRIPSRLPYTAAGLLSLWWLIAPPVDLVDEARDEASVLFVEIGVLLVFASILVVMYNTSPLLRSLMNRLGRRGHPVVRAAVAYPMGKKMRTGMTLAMFALTIFAITVIAMVQGLQSASLDKVVEGQAGGYEVAAYAQGYVPIEDFAAEVEARNVSLGNFRDGAAGIATATVLSVKVNRTGDPDARDYSLWGVDNFLIERNTYGFLSFLPSIRYEADGVPASLEVRGREDVWRALRLNRTYAVVDRSAAGSDQFVPDFGQLRLNLGDRVSIADGAGNAREFVILGILEQSLQFTRGVFVDRETVLATYDLAYTRTAYFFQLAPGVRSAAVRAELETAFFDFGLVTIDIREEIATQFDLSDRVLLLMQAYLALGLLVGITGLGVVTARAVVERRQEIGALRALGFTRGMVRNVFLLEIALVSLLGIAVGMSMGIVLSYNVYRLYFASLAVFVVPWAHLAAIVVLALLLTVAATAGPALRAAKMPPAQALRYVE